MCLNDSFVSPSSADILSLWGVESLPSHYVLYSFRSSIFFSWSYLLVGVVTIHIMIKETSFRRTSYPNDLFKLNCVRSLEREHFSQAVCPFLGSFFLVVSIA